METNNNMQQKPVIPPNNNKSSTMVGAFIILFGAFLLLKNLKIDYLVPHWLFGWQMILIIIGLVIGVNSKFEKKSSLILITIGSVFLLKEIVYFPVGKILIPVLAIILGVYLIKRNRKTATPPPFPPQEPTHPTDEFDWDKRVQGTNDIDNGAKQSAQATYTHAHDNTSREHANYNFHLNENYLKLDSVFGSAKKIILSKNFLGGSLTNIFGSTEINLLQADLNQPVVIDIFQLFGSTKIIVPPHWTISTSVSSILSENDDRRVIINHPYDENKKLFITGTSIFSSISIKNS